MTETLTFEQLPSAVHQLNKKLENIERLLLKSNQQQSLEQSEHLLTVQEAANFLGISVPTVYSKKSRGELPVCKPKGSKRLFFSKQALTDYILAGRQKSNAEIEAEAHTYLKKKGQQ